MTDRPALDPAFAPFVAGLKQLPPIPDMPLEQSRGMWRFMDFGQMPPIAQVRDLAVPGPDGDVAARLYVPGETPVALVVFYHGGGWTLGEIDAYDAPLRDFANDAGCAVLSVGYRLAPEHPFPAPLDDCLAVLRWASGERQALCGAPVPLIVAGDSAGGNLAAAAALAIRDGGGADVALQLLIYPATDDAMAGESYREHAQDGGLLTATDMAWFWNNYAPDPEARADPLAAPLRAETLARLPGAIVVVAEYDPLRDDALAYAARLEADGVPVTLLRHHTMPHGFFAFGGIVPAARAANREIAAHVRRAIAAEPVR